MSGSGKVVVMQFGNNLSLFCALEVLLEMLPTAANSRERERRWSFWLVLPPYKPTLYQTGFMVCVVCVGAEVHFGENLAN